MTFKMKKLKDVLQTASELPKHPLDIRQISREELNTEIEKGYADMLVERTIPIEEDYREIWEKYGIGSSSKTAVDKEQIEFVWFWKVRGCLAVYEHFEKTIWSTVFKFEKKKIWRIACYQSSRSHVLLFLFNCVSPPMEFSISDMLLLIRRIRLILSNRCHTSDKFLIGYFSFITQFQGFSHLITNILFTLSIDIVPQSFHFPDPFLVSVVLYRLYSKHSIFPKQYCARIEIPERYPYHHPRPRCQIRHTLS